MKLFFQNRHSNGRNHKPENIAEGKADFIRQITHDIKGDFFGVTSVCLILKLAIEKKDDPISILEQLQEACEDYKYKLNNFLEYTKFDAGMIDTRPESISLRNLLQVTVEEMESRAVPKAIRIQWEVDETLPARIIIDELQLKHITENILVNAINFSAPGSRIAVKAESRGNSWLLTISDHGIGMTREQLDCLFKLTPVERSSLKNPTGLGLLVTRYLAEDVAKGKLSFTSEPKVGTKVEIEFPLIQSH